MEDRPRDAKGDREEGRDSSVEDLPCRATRDAKGDQEEGLSKKNMSGDEEREEDDSPIAE